jgi:uncharacterized membrane protein YdjX (TVP38/TMEM64 family)
LAIAPTLVPGLAAYRRGDFAAARSDWESAVERFDEGADRVLALALARFAMALAEGRGGRDGAEHFLEAEAALGAVPDGTLGVDLLRLRAELARGYESVARRPPPIEARQRFPVAATARFLTLIGLLVAGVAAVRFTPLGDLLERDALVALFGELRESPWAAVVLLLLYLVLAPLGLPMTPLIIAGGIVFGRFWGALFNTLGCMLGAAVSYQLARLLGREFVLRIAGKRLKRVETLLRRRGFWSLVGVRFMPVPFPVVNFGAALAGVRFGPFLLTSLLGLLPAMLIYTSFAAGLFDVARGGDRDQLRQIGLLFALIVTISVTPTVIQQIGRKRRYQRLLLERQARALRGGTKS